MNIHTCHNPNIGFVTKCEVQGPIRLKMCLGVKHSHKWGRMQGMKPNDSQVHSHFKSCIDAKAVNLHSFGWTCKILIESMKSSSKYHVPL